MATSYKNKLYVLNSSCFACESNEFIFYFPKGKRITAKCASCGKERNLTHTEVNTYCADWS